MEKKTGGAGQRVREYCERNGLYLVSTERAGATLSYEGGAATIPLVLVDARATSGPLRRMGRRL